MKKWLRGGIRIYAVISDMCVGCFNDWLESGIAPSNVANRNEYKQRRLLSFARVNFGLPKWYTFDELAELTSRACAALAVLETDWQEANAELRIRSKSKSWFPAKGDPVRVKRTGQILWVRSLPEYSDGKGWDFGLSESIDMPCGDYYPLEEIEPVENKTQ